MKKILLSTVFFLTIAGFASAQTSGNKNAPTSTKHPSKSRKPAAKKTTAAKTVEPDNRKEYVKDGQKATATGHDASPTNGEQFQSIRDTANKKRKKQ